MSCNDPNQLYHISKAGADKIPAISPEKLKQMKKDIEKYLPHKGSERMKRNYLIRLKDEGGISGTSGEKEIDRFIREWKRRPTSGILSLTDIDGTFSIRSEEIETVEKLTKPKEEI